MTNLLVSDYHRSALVGSVANLPHGIDRRLRLGFYGRNTVSIATRFMLIFLFSLLSGLGSADAQFYLVNTDEGTINFVVLGEPIDSNNTYIDSITPIQNLNGTPFFSKLSPSGVMEFFLRVTSRLMAI